MTLRSRLKRLLVLRLAPLLGASLLTVQRQA
jgi:hypothetical protein